ncbi:LamG-like jellyroll fold domain-containing protein [Streptomyces sp. LN245]|uniref:LamG-like jellyroll fold domain-containing protein n=1 Tax=Streptomyces sp. LN245 TaxID=3112975 RepID=UPI003723AE86
MALVVEMGWGGLVQLPNTITWTDVSQRVDQRTSGSGVTINRGSSDELSETQPGSATLTLDNDDGRFTPDHAGSPYYPYVRENTPIRIAVALIPARSGSAPYPMWQLGDDFDDNTVDTSLWPGNYGGASEVGGRMRVPVNPGVTAGYQSARQWLLTGSKLTARLVTLPAAGGSSSGSASMWVNSTTSGTRLGWSYNPVSGAISCQNQVGFSDGSAVSMAYSALDHKWLRVRESGGTVYWESSGDGFAWTVRRSLATPAWVGSQTQLVEFAATRTGGVGDFIEWDLVGAEVKPRFYGMVNDWPVDWEGLVSTVTITCTDIFKRLNRLPPLKSMLAEEIRHQDVGGVVDFVSVYYPLTEEAGATSAGDLSGQGCGSLTLTQVGAGGTLEFGSDGLLDTGDTSVNLTPASSSAGKYLVADLGAQFAADSTTYWQTIEFWFKTSTVSRAIVGMFESGLDHQIVYTLNASGFLTIEHTDSGGTLTIHTAGVSSLADGAWHHVVHDGYVNKQVYVDGVAGGFTLSVVDMVGLRTMHVGGYRGARLFSGQIAHVAVTSVNGNIGATISPAHYQAATSGFSGEAADDRIQRLARYAGLPSVTVWGSTHDAIASQGPGGSGVVARMREVEATESGRLFAERDYYGLAYQSRDVRYNPSVGAETFTIDYADLETPRFQMAKDDQKLANSAEGGRPGGAVQKVTAPASILAFGEYPAQGGGTISLLKTNDNSVLDALYWTISRYALTQLEIREVPIQAYTLASYWDILDAEISSYFSVYNLPSQSPVSTMRVTVEGYTETIKEKSHLIQFRTSLSLRDSVWVLDDPVYSVLGTTTRLAY